MSFSSDAKRELCRDRLERRDAAVAECYGVLLYCHSFSAREARIITAKIDPSVKVGAINTKNNYIGLSAYPTYFVREWIAIPVEILK